MDNHFSVEYNYRDNIWRGYCPSLGIESTGSDPLSAVSNLLASVLIAIETGMV